MDWLIKHIVSDIYMDNIFYREIGPGDAAKPIKGGPSAYSDVLIKIAS